MISHYLRSFSCSESQVCLRTIKVVLPRVYRWRFSRDKNTRLSTPEQLRCSYCGVWEPGNKGTSTWQFHVEIEHYSIVYLDHITVSCGTELPLRVGVIQVAQLCPVCNIYAVHMSPTLNSEVQCFKYDKYNTIKIHNKIMFNIYQGSGAVFRTQAMSHCP